MGGDSRASQQVFVLPARACAGFLLAHILPQLIPRMCVYAHIVSPPLHAPPCVCVCVSESERVTHLKYQVDQVEQVGVSKVKETDPIYSFIC